MGRKDAQRTKGNTKAASSARSAQQLGDNVGFVGFGTSTESGFVPLLQGADVDDGVPGDFRLALRKMHKKDVTTKVKALQEFIELAENTDGETTMTSVLPYWPSVYNKLATDTDRRVRELAHTALSLVIKGVGRALAPHLKSLVGAWFLGQADPHTQAAAAASAAWELAFPAAKQAGAIAFCQAEILGAVTENLTVATAQSLSDPKTTPVEEMEAKYVRTLSMSLASLTRLLSTVLPPLDPKTLEPLLDHPKFWKFAKYKSGTVRQAFFESVVQLGSSHPMCLEARGKSVVGAVLPNLLETELMPARAVWAAALQVLSVVPSAWELTSPQKAVFPQVFKFIASSEGMAAATFPSLLPLLSKVPVEVMGDQEKFLDRWFSALQEGVGSVRGALELKAVLAAYLDCLFFVLNQEWLESGVEEHLVKNHLLMLFLRASAEPKMASAGVAQLMAPYLMAWDRQEKPKAAAGLFWHELSIEALARVDDNETRNAEALLGLLVSLQPPTGERPEHLKKLVEQLWHLLLLQLESTDRADAAARRLKVLHEATAESVLADPQKVVDQLLPLLPSPSHQASACALLWTITRLLPAPDLAAILSKVTDTIPKATQLLLNTVGKEAQNNAGVSLWLSSENMQAYVLLLLQSVTEPQREEDAFASLAALKTAGFQLIDSNTLWQQLVDTLTTFMPEDLTRACRLLDVVEASLDLWKGESAASLLLSLYKATPEDAGPELQLQKTWLKGVGGGLEAKVAALVRGQLAEEEEEQERLLAKCLLILDRLEEGSKDGFLLATMPAQEERVQFGGRSAELLCHRNFSTSAPSTSQLDSPQLGRPWGALFFCRLLLHRLGLALPVEEVNNSTASERSLEPIFLEQMGEVMLCIGYLTSLAGNSSCPAPVNPLLSSLSLAVSTLLSNLDKESCSQVQHLLRGNALREGGLWATGLAWLLDEIGTNVEPLMPRVDTWTDGELDTAAELLTLAVKQGKGEAMVMQCLGVETARIVSMGGFINPLAIGPTWLVSHCIEFSKEEFMAEEVRAVLDTLPAWRADNEDGLLFNCSLEATTWEQALPVATVAKLLTSAVNFCPSALSPALWDLASCSLVSWAASLEETGAFLTQSPAASLVAVAVARLGAALGTLLGPVGHHPALAPKPSIINAGEEEALPPRLREEWAEFFSESVFSSILQTFVSLSSQPKTSTCAIIQAELGAALVHCPAPVLMATPLSPLHMPQDVDSPPLPDSLTFFYNHLGPLLLSPSRNTQVSTAHLLAAVATDLVTAEGEGKDEEEERSLPLRLMEVVARGGAALEAVLQEWKVGEPAPTIPPGCAAHTAAMGFLLSWRVILTLISAAGQELRPRYSEFLRIRGHLDQLLDLLFRLLPSSPVPSPDYFCPELHPSAFPTSELEQLAGSCWVAVCRHLPALARHWWQEKDRQAAAAVEKLTCAVVTPLLWREETKAIEAAPASENMSLRVRDSVREVVATYSIDEGSMELVVSLPANHPLGGLTVESGKRVGVDTGQWRKWMLQLTTFLTHQNGTILDGLDLWRRNVDKRFEGVEECYICFYILHGSNHQLPKLGCRTCKKKFHSACLYKWFSTSNNSSCPLCRNLF